MINCVHYLRVACSVQLHHHAVTVLIKALGATSDVWNNQGHNQLWLQTTVDLAHTNEEIKVFSKNHLVYHYIQLWVDHLQVWLVGEPGSLFWGISGNLLELTKRVSSWKFISETVHWVVERIYNLEALPYLFLKIFHFSAPRGLYLNSNNVVLKE